MSQAWAGPFLDAGVLATSDVHAVSLVAARFDVTDPIALLGLALAARAPRHGHAGVNLAEVSRQIESRTQDAHATPPRVTARVAPDEVEAADATPPAEDDEPDPRVPLPWPDPTELEHRTLGCALVGDPADPSTPFVAQRLTDRTLVLTRRMYAEQQRVADALRARVTASLPDSAVVRDLDERVLALLPGADDAEARTAVTIAATRPFAMIIGGPGTGKTFSISRLLATLLEGRSAEDPLVVELAAPTGKAAARMQEAIREACAEGASPPLRVQPEVRAHLLALRASTLHKLLGVRPDGTSRHHAGNPLVADVVVVDEVSMVDLAMMRRLVEAVPTSSRLVLLGDRDQLASVEAGCVLSDLVGSTALLGGCSQAFTRSRRFADAPDVASIAACLQSYETRFPGLPAGAEARRAHAVAVFAGQRHALDERHPGARVTHLGEPDARGRPTPDQLDALAAPYLEGIRRLLPDGGVEEVPGYVQWLKRGPMRSGTGAKDMKDEAFQRIILDSLDRYRVLAVHRRGPLGVASLEAELAKRVKRALGLGSSSGRHWYGRPILVTENAYDVNLMNGDVGLILPGAGGLTAVFPAEDPGRVRRVALSRLPRHEGALVMTVHKSQGSQFDRVALVLASRTSPIQTRELVYTGVTRAKNQVAWLGRPAVLGEALRVVVQRASGLEALLSP